MDIIKEIRQLKCGKVIENANLKNYNTYKVDGTILGVVIPENVEDLKRLLTFLRINNIKHKIVGNGSNLIFCNNNYDGILIKLDRFNELKIEDTKITVGAGYSLMKLALNVSNLGLTGLEFATGIPGTVGGAIYMNAGAYKSDMGYVCLLYTSSSPRD